MRNEFDYRLTEDEKTMLHIIRSVGIITKAQITETLKQAHHEENFNYEAFTSHVIFDLVGNKLIFSHPSIPDLYMISPNLEYIPTVIDAYWVLLETGIDFEMMGSLYNGDFPVILGYLKGTSNYEIAYISTESYAPLINLCNRFATYIGEDAMDSDIQKYILIFEDEKMIEELEKNVINIPFKYLCCTIKHTEDRPIITTY